MSGQKSLFDKLFLGIPEKKKHTESWPSLWAGLSPGPIDWTKVISHLKMVHSHLKMVPPPAPTKKTQVFLAVIPIVTFANLSPVTISTPKSVEKSPSQDWPGGTRPIVTTGSTSFQLPSFWWKSGWGITKNATKNMQKPEGFFVLFGPNFGAES